MYLPMTISIVFCVHLVCAALCIDLTVCKAVVFFFLLLLFFFFFFFFFFFLFCFKYGAPDLR